MLFEGINSLPNNEYIRKLNIMHSRRKEIEDKKYDEFVSKQLKMTMIKTYEKQGMNLEQIEKEIKKFCEMQRKLELKKIDEQQGKIIL